MSCALPEETPNGMRASCDEPSALCADLANGLHAMAQPLTVLRGALGALTLAKAFAPEQERYLEMSTRQAERLCDMMSTLQGLVHAAMFKPNRAAVDLWQVIENVLYDPDPALETAGIRIEAARSADSIRVVGDAGRMEQALRAALKTAALVSSRDRVLQVEILSRNGLVDLIVKASGNSRKSFDSSDRLTLALAEANLRSQQGMVEWSEDPLRIVLKIPIEASAVSTEETWLTRSPMQHSGPPVATTEGMLSR
jgi:predicted RNA-binding protein YlqC (UPF0109 family)